MKLLPDCITLPRLATWMIIAICGLNLNGLFDMLFGFAQVFSLPLLLGAVYLIFSCRERHIEGGLGFLYVLAILAYICFGSLFSISSETEDPFKYIFTYFSSALVILAISLHISAQNTSDNLDLLFLKYILLTASASVWLSSYLNSICVNPPLATDRFSGFFGNPNEAGIISVIAFALVLARPSQHRVFQILQSICACGAVFMTFSKSSILLLALVFLVFSIFYQKEKFIYVLSGLLVVVFFISGGLESILSLLPEMTSSQILRIDQLKQIVILGEVSSETTTGRTYLWNLALDKITASFPFGLGLGELHNMIGGIKEYGIWQGCHNTYLMVLGESGIIAFILIVFANFRLLLLSYKARRYIFSLLYVVILQWDMMSAHNVLSLRFHNMLLGFCIGSVLLQNRPVPNTDVRIAGCLKDEM